MSFAHRNRLRREEKTFLARHWTHNSVLFRETAAAAGAASRQSWQGLWQSQSAVLPVKGWRIHFDAVRPRSRYLAGTVEARTDEDFARWRRSKYEIGDVVARLEVSVIITTSRPVLPRGGDAALAGAPRC